MKQDGLHLAALQAREVLRARARALARTPPPRAEKTVLEVLEFRLGPERYAVELGLVRQVLPSGDLTPLPCTPRFVAGMVNVRGTILPVLDLRKLLDLPANDPAGPGVLIHVRGADLEFVLTADEIAGVRSLAEEDLQGFLSAPAGPREKYLQGVTAEALTVLDLARILDDPDILVHEDVQG